jgi:hypothetical protein
MAGAHRKRPGAHVRLPAVEVPAQRGPRPMGITDALTDVEHLMTDDSAAAHRHAGNYLALCGTQVLAASLTVQSRSHCGPCQARAAR